MNPNAEEFQFNVFAADFQPSIVEPKFTPKETLFDYINKKPKKQKKDIKKNNESKKTKIQMVKAHIIQDGEVVTAKIPKNDLYSGAYQVVPRKITKLKQKIKEVRESEGIPPNQRPFISEYVAREYVNHLITHDLDLSIIDLLEKLKFFYTRKKEEKSNKKVSKRYVKGFNECIKKCEANEIKCIIMAPNIEKIEGPGGLDEFIANLVKLCDEKNIEIVFGTNMRILGGIMINQAALLAVIGILNYTACEKLYEKMINIKNRNQQDFRGIAYDPSLYYNIFSEN